jgi:hypothetical protein
MQFGKRTWFSSSSLESISVPASVEVLCARCFAGLDHLSSLTFEPGSKLRAIEGSVFSDCPSLESISLPPSLAVISGLLFAESSIERVIVDESNPHYFVSDDFLVAFEGMRLIRYFGHSETVTIGRDIEALGKFSFGGSRSLVTVAFEADSRLTGFDMSAFSSCSALTSICIPAEVDYIGGFCFSGCTSLAEVRFEQGSKLTRICRGAFLECCSLRLFVIPARLSILESGIFSCCDSLSGVIFEIPSTLCNLHLPMNDFVSLAIPDSVEILTGELRKCEGHNRLLEFGRESRLMKIRLGSSSGARRCRQIAREGVAVFVFFSEGAMRRFRCGFEAF